MTPDKPKTIDEYLAAFPAEVQQRMQQIRATIKAAVPEAEETISYAIPAFNYKGRYLLYFAAYKKHLGLYPVPAGNEDLENEYADYKTSGKGTIQFPLNKPLPLNLITSIAKVRAEENERKAAEKKTGKA